MALTSEQERALKLLSEGLSTAQVAERLRLQRPTVWRWQHELAEFAETLPEPEVELERMPLSLHDGLRLAALVLLLLLAALFFYLSS